MEATVRAEEGGQAWSVSMGKGGVLGSDYADPGTGRASSRTILCVHLFGQGIGRLRLTREHGQTC